MAPASAKLKLFIFPNKKEIDRSALQLEWVLDNLCKKIIEEKQILTWKLSLAFRYPC